MKVIPGMYADGSGVSYQLILSGHRQYNVKWMYGADHVVIDICDKHENPDAKFTEHKRVSIPGDYKGKPWREIAKGMHEHLKTVCSGLTRDWEGYSGMGEFREEWAMHTWEKRQKVSYKSIRGGIVLGVVKGTQRLGTRRVVLVRVTSRTNPLYRCGDVVEFSPTDPWLKSREV
ncbi:hypothetical protein ACF05W_03195 [Streptomyces lydicus]|uniref:hypothetical protein n=1 Tax=Streptomyces lydicus TaxID=47763 RepID=UPI0036FD1733